MGQTAVNDVTYQISFSSYPSYTPPRTHPLNGEGVGEVHDLILPVLTEVQLKSTALESV